MRAVLTRLAARLKQLRKDRGISQEDFAHKASLHRVGYGWIEQCKRTPNLATLIKIAAAFDISLSQLFSGIDSPKTRKGARK